MWAINCVKNLYWAKIFRENISEDKIHSEEGNAKQEFSRSLNDFEIETYFLK